MNWVLLQNSLLVSAATTLSATLLGWLAAVCLLGVGPRWRQGITFAAVIALALPPFLVTNTWLHYLGNAGTWQTFLPLSIYSRGGVVWILTLMLWPVTFLLVSGAWQRLQPAQLEADTRVRGRFLIQALLWPVSRPAVAQGAVLTFVLALNNFAVPAILQVKVLPAEMWVQFSTALDSKGALLMAWPLFVAPLLALLFLARTTIPWPRAQAPVAASLVRRQLGRAWVALTGALTGCLLLLASFLPLAHLLGTARTWSELPEAFAAARTAMFNSLWFAGVSTVLVIGLAVLACLASLPPGGRGVRSALQAIRWAAWMPFFLPGVLVGIVLIQALNQGALVVIYRSFAVVVLAFGLRYLALAWHSVAHGAESADPLLVDAARVEGASRWQLFRLVYWPQLSHLLAGTAWLIFVLCLWDVESMILIYPPGGDTLALTVFNLLHYGYAGQVNALCLTLVCLAVAPFASYQVWRLLRPARRFVRVSALAVVSLALLLTGCSKDPSAVPSLTKSRLFRGVEVIGKRGVGVGEVNKPRSVAVDKSDSMYVVDMTGRVQKFASNGIFQLSWQMPESDKGRPKGMCRDLQGNIVVNEPHYSRVNWYSPAGELIAQFGEHGTNAGQLAFPRAVAVNSAGELLTTEYGITERLQRFAGRGEKLLTCFGRMGSRPGEFNRPEGVCVDAQDRVYIADSCNHRIQVFSRTGEFLRAYGRAGSGPGELSYPYDICVDSQGLQYVCEFGNSRIQVFDPAGHSIEIIGGPGREPGRFSNPWGVALDSVGNLYVADSQNHRVQKLLRRT